MKFKQQFEEAVKENNIEKVNYFLTNKIFNPAFNNSWAFRYSAKMGYLEIIKSLLKNKTSNPASSRNRAIKYASKEKHSEIVKLLWDDQRVQNEFKRTIRLNSKEYNIYQEIKELVKKEKIKEF